MLQQCVTRQMHYWRLWRLYTAIRMYSLQRTCSFGVTRRCDDIAPQYECAHCNTATHCNKLQHCVPWVMHYWRLRWHCTTTCMHTLQHTATHCNTLQHNATHYNTLFAMTHALLEAALTVHDDTLAHTATHCNTLQHTTTHYVPWLMHCWRLRWQFEARCWELVLCCSAEAPVRHDSITACVWLDSSTECVWQDSFAWLVWHNSFGLLRLGLDVCCSAEAPVWLASCAACVWHDSFNVRVIAYLLLVCDLTHSLQVSKSVVHIYIYVYIYIHIYIYRERNLYVSWHI